MTVAIEYLHPLKGEVPAPSVHQGERLAGMSACLRAASSLDEAFDLLAHELSKDLPFERLGLAALTDGGRTVTSLRVHSPHAVRWGRGESRPLLGSSLEPMIREHAVRIIHDLKGYQSLRPSSLSTKRLIEEGMRSSLAIPLYRDATPLGILFLTSSSPEAFHAEHAGLLAALGPALDQTFSRLVALPPN